MTKFKPFLFGLLSGAGVVFLAMQYHVVHSQEGVRFVPRTPQHSIGLAYVDIRNWTTEDWADRPEVARACIACGMSDLVSHSVAEDLVDRVSADSPIDQLRGFLNENEGTPADGDSFLDGFLPLETSQKSLDKPLNDLLSFPANAPAERDAVAHRDRGYSDSGLRSVPRKDDQWAATQFDESRAQDPFRSGGAFSNSADQDSLSSGFAEVPATRDPRFHESIPRHTKPAPDELSPEEETNLLEQMIWGREPASEQPATPSAGSGFNEVTSAFENRATEALKRARAGLQNETVQTVRDSTNAASRALQNRALEMMPGSLGNAFKPEANSAALKSTLENSFGFDPFAD